MAKHLLFLIIALLSFNYGYSQTQTCDTLLSASNCKKLYIRSDKSSISIVAKGLDGENENFYYETQAAQRSSDDALTITKFHDVSRVVIDEADGRKLTVSFIGQDENPNILSFEIPDPENRTVKYNIGEKRNQFGINLSSSRKSSWDLTSCGFGIGWVTPLNTSPSFSTAMGRSLEFSWTVALGVRWNYLRNSVTLGLGFDWRNYSLHRGQYYFKEDGGKINIYSFDGTTSKQSSRLQTFSLQVPLLYQINIGKARNFRFTAGPILNFNTGGHITTKYTIGSDRIKNSTENIHQNPVTVDLFTSFTFHQVGLYLRYAPMNVLKGRTGLSFSSLSTGIIIGI